MKNTLFPEHYVTLKIRMDASVADVEISYRRLSVMPNSRWQQLGRWLMGRSPRAIEEAYRVLSDQNLRIVYDQELRQVQRQTPFMPI
jgi:curved DNA-binding protein CbpA